MRDLDERIGLRPRKGPFDCAWCAKEGRHDMCTGVSVRPNIDTTILTLHRAVAEVADCSCALRGHAPGTLRRRDGRLLGKSRRRYPRRYATKVAATEFVSQHEVARELGISVGRVGWLVACAHLEPAEDEDRNMGVTRASLEREAAWSRSAGLRAKARRVIGDTVRWV
jgi:hypothetical protein